MRRSGRIVGVTVLACIDTADDVARRYFSGDVMTNGIETVAPRVERGG